MNNQKHADVIVLSNAVFTGTEDAPKPGGVAIVGNRIACVGAETNLEPWIGPHTQVLQYEDKLIMPGFHDFHLHVMFGSIAQESLQLWDTCSQDDVLARVSEYNNTNRKDEWSIGFGWNQTYWNDATLPNRFALDYVVSSRPVLLFHADGHYAWVVEVDRARFRIRFHAIGDGAVRLALDAFKEARKQNGAWDSRQAILDGFSPMRLPLG